jgi:uroporphyrinogen-III decarboxylase
MTSRERWLSALRCEPIDRIPFWPKLDSAYVPYQTEPFRSMSIDELHRWIGSDQHIGVHSCMKTIRKKTAIKNYRTNGTMATTYETPIGTLTAVDKFDEVSHSWHPLEFPIKNREDIKIMELIFSDANDEFDPAQLEQSLSIKSKVGEEAISATGIGISPLMDWLQHLAGIENGHYMLNDYRDEVESLFDEMHKMLCRRAEIIADKSPADIIYSVENTSTTLISPDMYRKYCHKHLMDYAKIITSHDKFHILHQCGHLKKLLPDIAELPSRGIEAFTSPPVGNTTMKDGRDAFLDKCLIGGTNAYIWTRSEDEIINQIKHDLDELPHHKGIVLTSGGVMPPLCKPETIKNVADFIRNYKPDWDSDMVNEKANGF